MDQLAAICFAHPTAGRISLVNLFTEHPSRAGSGPNKGPNRVTIEAIAT